MERQAEDDGGEFENCYDCYNVYERDRCLKIMAFGTDRHIGDRRNALEHREGGRGGQRPETHKEVRTMRHG